MTRSSWQGWSSDPHQVALNRLVEGMVEGDLGGSSFVPDPYEMGSRTSLLDILDPLEEINRLGLLNSNDTFDGRTWSSKGREVATEFRRHAQGQLPRRPIARQAILTFLGNHGASSGREIQIDSILGEPVGWCYGTRFTEDELRDGARNLYERGFINVGGFGPAGEQKDNPFCESVAGAIVIPIQMLRFNLSAKGETCVERYDADPD